jgi:hypothetical protein
MMITYRFCSLYIVSLSVLLVSGAFGFSRGPSKARIHLSRGQQGAVAPRWN